MILKDNSKMKRKFFKLTVGMFLLVGATSVKAQTPQTDPINVVTTAVPFLRISPDARAGAMGDLGVATSPDANSPFWNLAKVPFAQKNFSVGLTYTPWLKDLGLNDVYLLALAGYYKLDEESALGGSVRYFSLGNIQLTDERGNELGGVRPREFGIDAGYTRKLSDKIGLGVALRYIRSNLAGNTTTSGTSYKPGSSVAGDLSFFYTGVNDIGEGWNFGATLYQPG